jgi:S-DNA-T family DNA segregation ATPase FtsK/SpoIIIE
LFFETDCADIKQYNRTHLRLRYQLVVIDEFADMMYEKDSIRLLEGLSAKARACGVHLILSTQRPDAKVLSSRIKANVPIVLGLKTNSDINSRIIIGESGLERLRGAGHGILRHGLLDEVQCPYLPIERAQELLRPYRAQEKPKTKDENESLFNVFEGL